MATGTLAHISKHTKPLKNAHKNAQKSSKNFKPSIHNVASTGTNFGKKNMAGTLSHIS